MVNGSLPGGAKYFGAHPKTVSGGILLGTDVHVFSVSFDVSIPGIDYLS